MTNRQKEGSPMGMKRGEEYSQDLRDRVLEAPGSIRQVGGRYGVSASYVSKVKSRLRLTGERSTKPRGGQRKPILAGREDLLRARVAEFPDATLAELQCWLLEMHDTEICVGALWNALQRLGLRFKKNPARRRARAA
jgi:transposase